MSDERYTRFVDLRVNLNHAPGLDPGPALSDFLYRANLIAVDDNPVGETTERSWTLYDIDGNAAGYIEISLGVANVTG